jgi:hypothetical protein
MQVHLEYTTAGHFHLLRQLFRNVCKVRFYLDQDSGMFNAWMGAFADRVDCGDADAFYVRITKQMKDHERRTCANRAWSRFRAVAEANPHLTEAGVRQLIIQEPLPTMTAIGRRGDRWLVHPFPTKAEPEKAVCFLTDRRGPNGESRYEPDHLARLYDKASLHAIDLFFLKTRAAIAALDRPASNANATRSWNRYSAYHPGMVAKALDLYRVYYYYCHVGEDKKTPAMRLGLAKAPCTLEDILYFQLERPRERVFKTDLERYRKGAAFIGPPMSAAMRATVRLESLRPRRATRRCRPSGNRRPPWWTVMIPPPEARATAFGADPPF